MFDNREYVRAIPVLAANEIPSSEFPHPLPRNFDAKSRDWGYSSTFSFFFFYFSVNSSPPLDKLASISQTTYFKCIFINEKFCISIQISLKFVPKRPIDNKPALV